MRVSGPDQGEATPSPAAEKWPVGQRGERGEGPPKMANQKSGLSTKPLFLLKQGAPAGFTRA